MSKEQQQIDYQDVMDLGGVHDQLNDSLYVNKYGFNYFWVDIELTKKFGAHWCCETRTVEIQKYGGEGGGDVLSKFPVKDLEELKMFINLFKGIAPKEKEFNAYTTAC